MTFIPLDIEDADGEIYHYAIPLTIADALLAKLRAALADFRRVELHELIGTLSLDRLNLILAVLDEFDDSDEFEDDDEDEVI